ncbi:MAG TPA: hypothetical protein PKJ47_07570 [Candidatus Limiplasma sp.]|nr:hypothetical protein [Candidatus Limiplasma sp.]
MAENHTPDEPFAGTQARASAKYEFFGSFSHAIDAKGRIIIPNVYRETLGEIFTIGPTREFKGIALYPNEVFDLIRAELSAMNQRKPFVQTYTMQFYKLSYRGMQADAQGRVLLPPKLRQRILGEAKDLEISGGADHVRIQDVAAADASDLLFMQNLDDILERMGDLNTDGRI